jgi:hypothetical protein
MPSFHCPICGKPVRDPEGKPFKRLLCTKCHSPLYRDQTGRALVGEPPLEDEYAKVKEQVRGWLAQVPVKKVAMGLAAVVILWMGLSYLLRPADRLEPAALEAAQAFAGDDLTTLKSMAVPGTAADLALWFAEVHPWLIRAREKWRGMTEVVEAHVTIEDRREKKGIAGLSIHMGFGTNLNVGLADPSLATAGAPPQVDLETYWTLNRWGHWKLDGRETYARVKGSQ